MMNNASVKEEFAKFLKQQLTKPSTTLITKEKADLIRSYLSGGTVQLDLNFTNTRVCLTRGNTRAKKYSLRVRERSGR